MQIFNPASQLLLQVRSDPEFSLRKQKMITWVWFNVAWNTSDAEVAGEKVHSSSDRLAAPGHIHSLQEKEHQSFSESCNFDKPLSLN
jgi:hypothetical protein